LQRRGESVVDIESEGQGDIGMESGKRQGRIERDKETRTEAG